MKTFAFSSAVVLLGSFQGLLAGTTPSSKNLDIVKRTAQLPLQVTKIFGEPHGSPFDDKDFINGKQKIVGITLSGCGDGEHLKWIDVAYGKFPKGAAKPPTTNAKHGTDDMRGRGITLEEGEFIANIHLTTYRAKTGIMNRSKRTRIGSISVTTNKQKFISCGNKNAGDPFIDWHYDGYALAYLTGSQGDAIDALSGVFMPKDQYLAN